MVSSLNLLRVDTDCEGNLMNRETCAQPNKQPIRFGAL
jgi:hypothetical protein